MRSYRLYHLEPGGRLRAGPRIEAADDAAATAAARELRAFGEVLEVWDQGRLVGRFGIDGAWRRP